MNTYNELICVEITYIHTYIHTYKYIIKSTGIVIATTVPALLYR